MEDHIVLICGLFSSINPKYRKWAYILADRIGRYYELRGYEETTFKKNLRIYVKEDLKLQIHIASSDGSRENKPIKKVKRALDQNALRHLIIGGHSNGVRDGTCKISETFYPNVEIPYAFAIDTTLAEGKRKLFGNVNFLDEFWAGLQRINFHDSFEPLAGKNYQFHDLDNIENTEIGHVEAASLPYVQDRIMQKITAAIPAESNLPIV